MFDFDIGIDRIYENDLESQKKFISIIAEHRNIPAQIFYDLKCFYVPNQEYLRLYFKECYSLLGSDLYNYEGFCKWHGYLMIPIRDVYGKTVGFTGYNPENSLRYEAQLKGELPSNLEIPEKYMLSSSYTFKRSNYALMPLGFPKAFNDGYIIVVDGVMDAIHLASLGINSFCNLGSSLGDCIINLGFIKDIIVAYDNDDAGLALYKKLKAKFPRARKMCQSKNKDIDGYLKVSDKQKFKELLQKQLESSVKLDIYL